MKKPFLIAIAVLVVGGLMVLRASRALFPPEQKPPVTAKVSVSVRGRRVSFLPNVVDADGRKWHTVVLPGGRSAPPPRVIVCDAAGKVVHEGSMEYG